MDVVCVGSLPVDIRRNLIRVESYCELPEARVQTALIYVDWHTKVVVRVARSLQVEVDFINRESKVCHVDSNENLSAVLDEAYGARLRFGVACSNKDAVKNALCPAGSLQVRVSKEYTAGRMGLLPLV